MLDDQRGSTPTKKLRLLHLDLKTIYSYGDQLLFELVRHAFNGFSGGALFELIDTFPFRGEFNDEVIDHINQTYDGVVIGGGGLFPWRTNASPLSGWQWNCSVPVLQRLTKPLVIFGVGNPPRYSPQKHSAIFKRHITEVVRRSAFVGLRSRGAADSLKDYVPVELKDKISFQPCPTTIGGTLLPSFCYTPSPGDEKVLGIQFGLEAAHKADGLKPEVIHPRLVQLITRLRREGWVVEFVGHKRSDMAFATECGPDLGLVSHRFFGNTKVLFEGARKYGQYSMVLGARGHSQMIPFGLESIPLSFGTNDKIRFFAQHVGHPEWLIDPWGRELEGAAYNAIIAAHEHRTALRADIRTTRAGFLETTLDNLSAIYQSISGVAPDKSQRFIRAYTEEERAQAQERYRESYTQRGEGM